MHTLRPVVLLLAASAPLLLTASSQACPPAPFTFPADFEMTTCYGETEMVPDCQWSETVLHANGDWEHVALHLPYIGVMEYTLWGSWELRKGNKEIEIVYPQTYFSTTWTGSRTTTGCYAGTVYQSSNPPQYGVWEGCVVP